MACWLTVEKMLKQGEAQADRQAGRKQEGLPEDCSPLPCREHHQDPSPRALTTAQK